MNTNWWNFTATPDLPVYSGSQPFPTNISSYFRRPAKIIKPSSRTQSPRNSSRRRMTTQFPARTKSVAETQRSKRVSQWSMRSQPPARPTSWHPSPMTDFDPNDFNQSQCFTQVPDYTTLFPYSTTNVNGLVTPMSYPVHDEPQIQELITPLEELSAREVDGHYLNAQQQVNPYWNGMPTKVSHHGFDPAMQLSVTTQMWWPNQGFNAPNVATAPTSPDFLPMPDMGDPFAVAEPIQQQPKDELVGMGLYDSPADVQSASLLFGGNDGSIGRKGLKLEESFEPNPSEEDDDEDEDDAEEDSVADEQQSQLDSDVGESHVAQQQTVFDGMGQYSGGNNHEEGFVPFFSNGGYMPSQWQTSGYTGYGWI